MVKWIMFLLCPQGRAAGYHFAMVCGQNSPLDNDSNWPVYWMWSEKKLSFPHKEHLLEPWPMVSEKTSNKPLYILIFWETRKSSWLSLAATLYIHPCPHLPVLVPLYKRSRLMKWFHPNFLNIITFREVPLLYWEIFYIVHKIFRIWF